MYYNEPTGCECCKPRWTTSTSTTHKWTEKEIKAEIIEIARDISKKKWYESKTYLRDRLNHWCLKLNRLEEVKSEIDLNR